MLYHSLNMIEKNFIYSGVYYKNPYMTKKKATDWADMFFRKKGYKPINVQLIIQCKCSVQALLLWPYANLIA